MFSTAVVAVVAGVDAVDAAVNGVVVAVNGGRLLSKVLARRTVTMSVFSRALLCW